MRNTSMDWAGSDSIGADLWLQPPIQQEEALPPPAGRNSDAGSAKSPHTPRSEGMAFAEQLRKYTFEILMKYANPLSTHQIRSEISSKNPEVVWLLDQRKSTSCMSKILFEDPGHRFSRHSHVSIKKPSTFFGISGKDYDSSIWLPKTEEKSPDKSRRTDIELTEQFREIVKLLLLQRGNKPLTCMEIIAIIKKETPEMAQTLDGKSRNYLIKTLRRDPRKRFLSTKTESGMIAFTIGVQ